MKFLVTASVGALIFLVFVTGCATRSGPPAVSITANKEVGYVGRLQRVVLVSAGSQPDRTNVSPLIASKLREKGVFVEMVIPEPMELNKGQSVRSAIARTNATHVFVVTPGPFHKRVMTTGVIRNVDATELIETQIQSLPLGNVIWRGRNVLTYTSTDSRASEEAVALSVLQQLVADALLNP